MIRSATLAGVVLYQGAEIMVKAPGCAFGMLGENR